ncbi:MAG: MgtC/SapB family protein [Fusobacteriaceae bacterium]|jgi:putative Mg2+ transporter-C (MgtC) family protein|nr:MgtC/SapB family protein [Fusobacteriaceae bacterium]
MSGFVEKITILDMMSRIGIAILVGGMIGYERGYKNRPAGFRTHIIVCLGATVVSIIQDQLRINVFDLATKSPHLADLIRSDIGRIGAQVISGIGFLGAGTIMSDKGSIRGLTTAASIWATGCIGLGIGWGFYQLSIIAALAVLVTLVVLKGVETRFIENRIISKVSIKYNAPIYDAKVMIDTYKVFEDFSLKIKESKKNFEENIIMYTLIVPKQEKMLPITIALFKLSEIDSIDVN